MRKMYGKEWTFDELISKYLSYLCRNLSWFAGNSLSFYFSHNKKPHFNQSSSGDSQTWSEINENRVEFCLCAPFVFFFYTFYVMSCELSIE